MAVVAVVVRWRGGDEVRRCLRSLTDHGGPALHRVVLVDSGSVAVRKRYERLGREQSDRFRELFASMDVDQIEVMTDRDYIPRLVHFFRMRERRH